MKIIFPVLISSFSARYAQLFIQKVVVIYSQYLCKWRNEPPFDQPGCTEYKVEVPFLLGLAKQYIQGMFVLKVSITS